MEIVPNKGIGTVEFGMTPREVMIIMGQELVYEDWMGGNLNDSLYYPGIVFCFKNFDGYGPLEVGSLIEIWIHDSFNATYKGISLTDLKYEVVEQLLQLEGISYTTRGSRDYGDIYVEQYNVDFCFDKSNLVRIYLYVPR